MTSVTFFLSERQSDDEEELQRFRETHGNIAWILWSRSELASVSSHICLSSSDGLGVPFTIRFTVLPVWIQIHLQSQSSAEGEFRHVSFVVEPIDERNIWVYQWHFHSYSQGRYIFRIQRSSREHHGQGLHLEVSHMKVTKQPCEPIFVVITHALFRSAAMGSSLKMLFKRVVPAPTTQFQDAIQFVHPKYSIFFLKKSFTNYTRIGLCLFDLSR